MVIKRQNLKWSLQYHTIGRQLDGQAEYYSTYHNNLKLIEVDFRPRFMDTREEKCPDKRVGSARGKSPNGSQRSRICIEDRSIILC